MNFKAPITNPDVNNAERNTNVIGLEKKLYQSNGCPTCVTVSIVFATVGIIFSLL
jgi:hypothetical protein